MAFFDSNGNKRIRSIGKALTDFKAYTKFQGKQACDAMRATELLASIKQSEFVVNNKNFFGNKKTSDGPVKHQSLKEDDEAALWTSEDESDLHQSQPKFQTVNKFQKSNGKYSHHQELAYPKKTSRRGIKIPFLKH